tara:strand:+ start:965 stop:1336 length:372 start_codon:yes stop_codon:yes gene_type:complete
MGIFSKLQEWKDIWDASYEQVEAEEIDKYQAELKAEAGQKLINDGIKLHAEYIKDAEKLEKDGRRLIERGTKLQKSMGECTKSTTLHKEGIELIQNASAFRDKIIRPLREGIERKQELLGSEE